MWLRFRTFCVTGLKRHCTRTVTMTVSLSVTVTDRRLRSEDDDCMIDPPSVNKTKTSFLESQAG